jgi:hypothetical protein
MQLVAYGAQDIYLTGNPMITYFKVVYRRHTNFAMESIQQTFNGSVGFNNRVTALISRNGDLVSGMTLEATLPATTAGAAARWTDDVGHHLIKQVEVEIGGQLIDRHYADWLEIWAQLSVPASKKQGYRQMIGQDARDQLGQPLGPQSSVAATAQAARKLYIPLQFWFCRNIGLALPLIALQYHEVKVNIQFESSANLLVQGTVATGGELAANLWVDYVYLDTDERRRFAQVSHEYLIEQLQVNEEAYSSGITSLPINLNFNHPVKELVWVARSGASTTAEQWSNYTDANPVLLPTEATVAAIDGRYQNTDNNVANTRRATFYEAQGQWYTAPREMLATATITQVNVPAAAGSVTAAGLITSANHGLAIGDAVILTLATGDGATPVAADTPYVVLAGGFTDNAFAVAPTAAGPARTFTADTQVVWGRYNPPVPALGVNPITTAKLQLNGHDRFAVRDGTYFNLVQPFDAHTCIPDSPGINVYSFALKPEEHQPSGTCNFSRIDNAKLQLTLSTRAASAAKNGGIVKVFATNYNVLRVMSGMGGLAYSN